MVGILPGGEFLPIVTVDWSEVEFVLCCVRGAGVSGRGGATGMDGVGVKSVRAFLSAVSIIMFLTGISDRGPRGCIHTHTHTQTQ
jgi:hypothetical protein